MNSFLRISAISFLMLVVLAATAQSNKPVKVEVVKDHEGFKLLRDGKQYFVKGAGGTSYMEKLPEYGGNSVRTWSTRDAMGILDKAQALGLTVTMGLDVARERHGFNYDDTTAVKKQLEKLRKEVITYKDHPALLMWGIGNELNLSATNPKVWDAVNDISKMIHEVDPNHPSTTMLAGVNKKVIEEIKVRTPDIDLLSVQTYGSLPVVPDRVKASNWTKAYMVTEWGPTGHWESKILPWKAAVEETSSQKAAVYKSRYEASIQKDKNCLGSYVFLWGQKQERTPTWYGLFTEAGEGSEVLDVMHYLWSGKWPANQAPHLETLALDGKQTPEAIYLSRNQSYKVVAIVTDPNKDQLAYRWELLPESTDLKEGGDKEARPKPITGLITENIPGSISLRSPKKSGAYRLFLYASDGKNKVATGNIPFYVSE
ncbi:glycoside hydrolase family 2 TIM barrel-domain containing protein [Daejeonella sp.]|uniref:glycoside hydrolase family 2 TIM barrel-domain containing protein n=1 Tax=Daejeonella sp. TaxID=2805397 RepID=UPI0030C2346B